MTNLDGIHHSLANQFQDLRDSIADLRNDAKYVQLLDEFLREQEFGLALEAVCDFLLGTKGSLLSESVLEKITHLHQLMNIQDDCVQNLRQKVTRPKTD